MKRLLRLIVTASIWSLILSFVPILALSQSRGSDPRNYKFVNGLWFNGKSFRPQTFYSVDGLLSKKRPRDSFETVDLGNEFVLPPFAEAHNHNLGSAIYLKREFIEQMIQRYLAAGVFYVKIPGNPGENATILRREFVNRPDSVDVSYANGVLTSRDGHPIGMTIEGFKEAGATPPSVADLDGSSIFVIEGDADLQAKWARIMAGKPDFIKTILSHSESFASRRANAALFGYNGLDPQLLPSIVKRAHASGLRVSTHIYSAADFAAAVRAGVDEINHMPGIRFDEGTSESDYIIAPEVAKQAAELGIIVVATAGLAQLFAKGEALARTQSLQRKNLELLKKSGVRLAVGSDNYGDTSVEEVMYLKSLNIFENSELLRMWCETGAQTTFPERRIGHLREGYESSFIVLRGDPIKNFEGVKNIHLRFKQGHFMVATK